VTDSRKSSSGSKWHDSSSQNREKRSSFPPDRQRELEIKLGRLANICNDLWWEWDGEGTLIIGGIEIGDFTKEDEVPITHFKSARALLDGFLAGYDMGYGHGKYDAGVCTGDRGEEGYHIQDPEERVD
jgi:hypothetical protein